MNRTLLKVVFSGLVKVGTFPLRILPIRKKRILFTGLTGGRGYDYSCNPKYIYEYLRDTYKSRFEYVWAVSSKEQYGFLEEEGVKLVKHFTVSCFHMLLTSKVIVTNGSYVPWFPFRRKQYVINTWHGGGAYKKVAMETEKEDWAARRMVRFCADNMDLFVASCKTQEEQMIRQTYQYQGAVLKAGTPRNDKLFFRETKDMTANVKKYYNIEKDCKIVLYAPTYRHASSPVVLNGDLMLDKLEQDGSSWIFLSRYHRYQKNEMNVQIEGRRVVDVMDYPDMQELLATTDLLITDYSSCVWDYALLNRPCILYIPDWKEYTKRTGFYVSLEKWPFLRAESEKELLELLTEMQNNQAVEKEMQIRVKQHLKELGSYETGNSRKQIAEIILKQTESFE